MEIRKIEEMSLNAHPALNTMYLDGWYLRFSEGYTKRANSVNVLSNPDLPVEEKIAKCESLYAKKNLPTVFKITPLSQTLDSVLEKQGYALADKTNLMTLDTLPQSDKKLKAVVNEGITEEWQKTYFHLNNVNVLSVTTAKKIQSNIICQTLCATLFCGEEAVACGLCVIEHNYAGLYDIVVAKKCRRKGYGREICLSLLSRARECGAIKAYLQVVDENEAAKELYKGIGFRDKYSYWYRILTPVF